MIEFDAPWVAIRSFFESGGDVLWAIFAATLLMWTLIIERFWFFRSVLPKRLEAVVAEWEARANKLSWASHSIRAQLVSQIAIETRRYTGIIEVLMVILPLLGLLGTVTGMIQVFNVMAIAGTSNARLMAGGVSAATIPTMAGLVAALSGLYLSVYLKRRAETEIKLVQDALVQA
jgi:biopolymer transport protein ExbB